MASSLQGFICCVTRHNARSWWRGSVIAHPVAWAQARQGDGLLTVAPLQAIIWHAHAAPVWVHAEPSSCQPICCALSPASQTGGDSQNAGSSRIGTAPGARWRQGGDSASRRRRRDVAQCLHIYSKRRSKEIKRGGTPPTCLASAGPILVAPGVNRSKRRKQARCAVSTLTPPWRR